MTGFKRLYGSHPLHLGAHLVMFLVAGWAITQILGGGNAINWLVWFIGAALLHDLVLLPIYSLLDSRLERSARFGRRGQSDPATRQASFTPVVNHFRVPAAIAGILLLVYFPVILGYSSTNYFHDTGHALTGYTRNWLLVSVGLFVCSGLVYLVRVIRRPASPPTPGSTSAPMPGPAGEQSPG
ncbi:MAG: hypothetical protein M3022_03910 [Actinomycetota bacterium]|nr:hypothetical protein [Actinomycetota bacterium]